MGGVGETYAIPLLAVVARRPPPPTNGESGVSTTGCCCGGEGIGAVAGAEAAAISDSGCCDAVVVAVEPLSEGVVATAAAADVGGSPLLQAIEQ